MRISTIAVLVFRTLVVLRAAYAALLCIAVLAYRFGFGNYVAIEEHLGQVLMDMPIRDFAIWGAFVVGYVIAAILLLLRSRLALPVYAAAFATDFMLSLYWFQQPAMDRAYFGSASAVEWTLNAIDLSVIAILLLAGRGLTGPRRRRRAG